MWWLVTLLLAVALAMAGLRLSRARRDEDRVVEENRRLAQDRQRLFEFMQHMTEALGEGLSRAELQQRIVHASILSTGALSGCIFEQTPRNTMRGVAVEGLFPPHRPLREASGGRLGTRARFIEEVLKSEEFPLGEGVVGRVARTRRGELLADAAADPGMVKHDDPALAVRSVIVVPLVFRTQFFGVLAVANPVGEAPFGESDLALLQSLAKQAALALHNAAFLHLQLEKGQLDLELSLASGIQQMLLPREMPRLAGLDIDARYKPAQRVGGDLFDFVPLPDGRLGVIVADVSGKGIPASLLMAICRTHVRQIATRHTSAGRTLVELNRALGAEMHPGLFITMVYAIVDVPARRVTIARAGHELPLLLWRQPGGLARVEFVRSEGIGLGMVPDALFAAALEERTEPFGEGDLLVVYTDGVTEAPNEAGQEFSGARLADVVREQRAQPAKIINDRIEEAVERFSGDGTPRDDFTLVTVKRG